jgi:integrase/recombinase XerD
MSTKTQRAGSTQRSLPFNEAIDAFLQYLAVEKGLSVNYQLSNRRSLQELAAWCDARGLLDPRVVQMANLTDYLSSLKVRGLGPASLRLAIVAIKLFYRFLSSRYGCKRDPAELLRAPRVKPPLPRTLSQQEMNRLLAVDLSERRYPLRDRAILELLYGCGLRATELATLQLANLNLEERILRVVGKGDKTRLVPMGRTACAAILDYLKNERSQLTHKPRYPGDKRPVYKPRPELFLSQRRANKLTFVRIWQLVRELARLAGFTKDIYPHLLRHSFASHLLQNDCDLRVIQELLGHADISTTEIYTHLDLRHLEAVYKRCHPRAVSAQQKESVAPIKMRAAA